MKTWKDIYKLPLKFYEWGPQVYDADMNFVFQFEGVSNEDKNRYLSILNNDEFIKPHHTYFYNSYDQYIYSKETVKPVILIRGWGNLTGNGAHNLSDKEAANIQDTFAEWIVERLNPHQINTNINQ